jgi:hypothetical protein
MAASAIEQAALSYLARGWSVQRNDAIASFTGHLLWHGIDPAVARELLVCWNRVHCRPPLADDEVRRTVQSIARTHFRHHGGSAS